YSSTDVENLRRSGGSISLSGIMDNTGHTFTFDEPKGSWALNGGRIIGGTLILNTPIATLDIIGLEVFGNFLDGVTIDGSLELGVSHQLPGTSDTAVTIRNGLSVNGTVTGRGLSTTLVFDGTQTVQGGIFVNCHMQSQNGEVTLDAAVTL